MPPAAVAPLRTEPVIIQTDQTGGKGSYVMPTDNPLGTIVTKQNMALVEFDGQAYGLDLADPKTVRLIRQGRVVFWNGVVYLLDVLFRMLEPYELAHAMSFTDGEYQYEFVGNKTEVTKQIGNSVPVGTACALIMALLMPHEAARAA